LISLAYWNHRAYGLVIRSEIPLPPLEMAPASAQPDVLITLGPTPDHLEAPVARGVGWELTASQILIHVGKVARCLISHGGRIRVTPAAFATEADIRFAILNGALGPALHQRGVFVLHASAIDTPTGAVAFAGHSGIGKSTMVLAMMRQLGAKVLCDDIAAVTLQGDPAEAVIDAGIPTINVWRDAAMHLGCPVDESRAIRPAIPKFMVSVGTGQQPHSGRRPLNAVVLLEAHNESGFDLQTLTGKSAFAALRRYTRGLRVAELVQRTAHFNMVSHLARAVRISLVRRPKAEVGSIDRLVEFVWPLVNS